MLKPNAIKTAKHEEIADMVRAFIQAGGIINPIRPAVAQGVKSGTRNIKRGRKSAVR